MNFDIPPTRTPLPERQFAYCDSNGHAVFVTTVAGGSEPHAVDNLTPVLIEGSLPQQPSPAHKLHAATKTWADIRSAQEKIADEWFRVRERRNRLLTASDFSQLPDSPRNRQAWAAYRQELRDITQQPDPFNLAWPTPPSN